MSGVKERHEKRAHPGTMLRVLGFCGADDSVHPNMLGLICDSYPFVEFGILFRPDKVRYFYLLAYKFYVSTDFN